MTRGIIWEPDEESTNQVILHGLVRGEFRLKLYFDNDDRMWKLDTYDHSNKRYDLVGSATTMVPLLDLAERINV